jgi:hypothetical protein
MTNRCKNQAGVTLVEILVWITITAILGAALSGLFSSLIKNYMYGQRRYDIQQTADLVLLNISTNLRYGEGYKVVEYEHALDKALEYTSIKPDETGTFLYYIDKDDLLFYRVSFTGGSPELAPGQTFLRPGDIQIGKITNPNTDIFEGDTDHMNISIRVIDTVYGQHIDQRTMIIPIYKFVK